MVLLMMGTLWACGPSEHGGDFVDGGTDADPGMRDDSGTAESDAATDASADVDAADAGEDATDAGAAGVAEIVSPRSGAQFYAFEDVTLRGVCHGAPDQKTPSARFVTLPAHFSFASFDRTSRYVLGLQRGATSAEKNRVVIVDLEHPEQLLVVSPPDLLLSDGEHPIWVP